MKSKYGSIEPAQARGIGVALALAMMAQAACADTPTYCVTNDADLVSALTLAQSSALTVQLMQNTYHLNQTVWNANLTPSVPAKFFSGSSLLGGYTNATCSARDIDVGNTIITDTTAEPSDQVNILGDATIEGITFNLPFGLGVLADSIPLRAGSQVTIRRNVFTQSIYGGLAVSWDQDASVGGTVRVVNNLIHDTSGLGPAIFFFASNGKPTVELINNTVVDNTSPDGGVYLSGTVNYPVYAYNNIFYGNTGKDLLIESSTQVVLSHNVIGTHNTYPASAQVTASTSADPKLDSFFKPIESPPSPVINTGADSVAGGLPATDLPGRARAIGSEPDRGAFESSINDSSTQMVTNTNDSGPGSLRAAILSANALGTYTTILFDLGPNCGPFVIAPLTPLPNITASMQIVGLSQAGATPNDLLVGDDAVICVILDGTPHTIADGLMVAPGAPDAIQLNVVALAFSGFSHGAVSLYGGSAHIVQSSHIGGSVGGTSLDPVGNGVIIGPGVHDVTIGGDPSANTARNILGSATGSAVVIDGANGSFSAAHDNHISNNYIGVGWSSPLNGGFTNRGNGGAGVVVAGHDNDVQSNYIEYNGGYGVELTGTDANHNYVASNFIGYLDSATDVGSGNVGGVVVQNDAHDNEIQGNAIYYNSGTAVRVVNGAHNLIIADQFHGNGGLAIDLAGAGVTQNDNDPDSQPADYANAGLNFPVITSAIGGVTKGTISGTLTTAPGTYHVALYASPSCHASGHGEGQYQIAYLTVTAANPDVNGQATATFSTTPLTYINYPNYPAITAIAIDDSNYNTSEFSACFTYVNDTLFANGFESN